jgi:hypothetical protein
MEYLYNHQDVRVLSVTDTIETLSKLQDRLKDAKSEKQTKRVKGVESLSLTLALVDMSVPQDDLIISLCQAVARCFPKLKSLQLSSEMDDCEDPSHKPGNEAALARALYLPIQALTALLHPNKGLKKLKELTLDGLCFRTDDEHMRILGKAIARHEHLQKGYLYETMMTTLSTGRSGMEKFVSALSKKLEKLVIVGCELAAHGEEELWAGACLVKLCRSNTLRELKLHNLDELREEHIVLMAQELTSNKSIRKLSILKSQELTELPQEEGLKVGSNHKKRMLLAKTMRKREALSSDAGTLAMANMLRVNTALEEVCLSAVDFNEYSAMFLGNALEQDNTTLRELWLMIPAHNGGTSSFPVDDRRIDYYLRLNRAGRHRVIQQQQEGVTEQAGKDKKEFINTLVLSKRDIDCSFFLLRKMPSLCDVNARIVC